MTSNMLFFIEFLNEEQCLCNIATLSSLLEVAIFAHTSQNRIAQHFRHLSLMQLVEFIIFRIECISKPDFIEPI